MKDDRRAATAARLRHLADSTKLHVDVNELIRMLYQVKIDKTVHHASTVHRDYLAVVFLAMARRRALPSLATVRYACRLVRQNKELTYCESLLNAIVDSVDLQADLVAIHQEIRESQSIRYERRVESTAYKSAIQQFLASIRHLFPPPLISFSDPNAGSFSASTNGKRLFLPHRVDVSDGHQATLINEAILFFLAFHEAQHWGIFGARSSFGFSFDQPYGKELLSEVQPNAEELRDHLANRGRQEIFRRLLSEEGYPKDTQMPSLTHLEVVALSSPSERLFHWFYNAFEDLRIHRQAIELGMGELQEITNRMSLRSQEHPVFNSPFVRFLSHIVSGVGNQDRSSYAVPKQYRVTLAEIMDWIDQCHQSPSSALSPELSATFAFRSVCMIFERHRQDASDENLNGTSFQSIPVEQFTEIMLRWWLTREQREDYERQNGGSYLPPTKEVVSSGLEFDEFIALTDMVEHSAVTVQTSEFKPARKPHQPFRFTGHRGMGITPTQMGKECTDTSKLDIEGEELAFEVIPESLAALHAGMNENGKHYWNAISSGSDMAISVLIDLSVSMEQVRKDLPALPMQMAISAITLIREEAVLHGADLEVWGIIDGGRQPVSLLQIQDRDIPRIHSLGIGGARMGTGIRFISRRRSRTTSHHLIICLTDGSSTYANEGHDDTFKRIRAHSCAACQLRSPGHKGCSVEKGGRGGVGDAVAIYRNADYQYADIGHAIDTAPTNTEVRYIEFLQVPFDTILNRYMPNSWRVCTGHLDLSGPGKKLHTEHFRYL